MTLDDLDEFVREQVDVVEESLLAPSDDVLFTSGGTKEDVWSETRAKAVELFCYEFGNWVKARKAASIAFVESPVMLVWPVFTKTDTSMLEKTELYCVSATLQLISELQEEDAAA